MSAFQTQIDLFRHDTIKGMPVEEPIMFYVISHFEGHYAERRAPQGKFANNGPETECKPESWIRIYSHCTNLYCEEIWIKNCMEL